MTRSARRSAAAGRTFVARRGEGVSIALDRSEAISGLRPVYRPIDDAELELAIFAAEPG